MPGTFHRHSQRVRTPSASAGSACEAEAHVLVVGADAHGRALMLEELRSLLPADTAFVEADETWRAIALAAESRMVVLAGDLGDVSAASLLRMLARRHPGLPILAVGADRRLRERPSRSSAGGQRGSCQAVDPASI